MDTREEIFIGIPTRNAMHHGGITLLLSSLERASYRGEIPYRISWQIVNGKHDVEYARNVIVGVFLRQTQAGRLWFIDDDMLPSGDAIRLLDSPADIVAGRAWAFNHANDANGNRPSLKLCAFTYNGLNDFKFNPLQLDRDGELECDAVGTATMVIRRRVLEDRRMWLDEFYTGLDGDRHSCTDEKDSADWAPPVFRTQRKPNGEIMRGEDLDFCLRAKDAGYVVAANLGVGFGHQKLINIDEIAQLCSIVARRTEDRVRKEIAHAGEMAAAL